MYAIERTRIIKLHLEEHGQTHVQTLSSLLGVSEVTIRRDLERLEAEGWLTRTHGGAIINRLNAQDSLAQLLTSKHEATIHDGIVSIALQMVSDGDVILLTNGEVNRCIAARLGERENLTVLTNDIACTTLLTQQKSNNVVLLGGTLNQEELAVFGTMTLSNLNKFYVNRLFVEVDGISEDLQLTVNSQEKADFILEAKTTAKETIIICPANRFSHNAFFRLGNLRFAQRIISNSSLDDSYKSRIFAADIPLYSSVAAFEGRE